MFVGTLIGGALPALFAQRMGTDLEAPGPYGWAIWVGAAVVSLATVPLLGLGQLDLFSGRLVSDYLFAKDRIFANINLDDEDLRLYEHVAEVAADIVEKVARMLEEPPEGTSEKQLQDARVAAVTARD